MRTDVIPEATVLTLDQPDLCPWALDVIKMDAARPFTESSFSRRLQSSIESQHSADNFGIVQRSYFLQQDELQGENLHRKNNIGCMIFQEI